jgi:hypothetical protein
MSTRNVTRLDPDGVRVSADPRRRRAARLRIVSVVIVAACAAALYATRPAPAPRQAPHPVRAGGEPARIAAERPVKVLVQRPSKAAKPSDERRQQMASPPAPRTDAVAARNDRAQAADEKKDARVLSGLMSDVVEGLRVQGGQEGIGVYPPKGTNPPKPGLVVPKDFPLPEGYMRYHQVTDDGRRLDPILVFSPDYDFVDADGMPIAIPESGIVPPEMAPPGLPIRILEIPDERAAAER